MIPKVYFAYFASKLSDTKGASSPHWFLGRVRNTLPGQRGLRL